MSHIARIKAEIGTVNEAIMAETLQLICEGEEGAELVNTVHAEGRSYQVDAGLKTKDFQSGVGMNWRKSKTLEFLGDRYAYGQTGKFDEIRQMIVQTYQILACKKACQEMGYQVQTPKALESGKMRLEAVRA